MDKIDPRAIPRILRIEGLLPFTGCAILLGFVVALREAGVAGASWGLFVIAAVAALLVHIDGHIWNDITDLEIDRREKSKETRRDRPLVFGWATVAEYRKISLMVTVMIVILATYLTTQRILTPLLFVIGFFFDYGYNHPRIALSHRPWTEWYLFPWLVVGVTVTVVYAATGLLSSLAVILSLLLGLTATCFVVSMMRRDAISDRLGGKQTSSVRYPAFPHATFYGIVTILVAILVLQPLAEVLENPGLAYLIVLVTVITAAVMTMLGAGVDQLFSRARCSAFPDFERIANNLMLVQVGVSTLYALVVSGILLFWGNLL